MDKARVKAILDEHVGPMLTMDDGRGVMQAQQRQGEVLDLLENRDTHPAQELRTTLLQYMWEQISVSILQTKLREVYSTSALAFLREDPGYEYIRPFLECDIVNDGAFRSGGSAEVTDPITATVTEDRKKEENDVKVVSEAEAKITLYNAWGLLTQPAPKEWDPVTDWETSVMELMRDIKEYRADQPDKYEDFLRLGMSGWKEGEKAPTKHGLVTPVKGKEMAEELLKSDPELLGRFRVTFGEV